MYLLFQIPSFHSPGSSTPMYDNCEKSESPLSLGIGVRTSVVLEKHMYLQEKELSSDKETYAFNRMDTWTKNALDEKRIYIL